MSEANCGTMTDRYHNGLIPYIISKVGTKELPDGGMCVIHFDASPDLDSPQDLLADQVADLKLSVNFENGECWLLPLIYAGFVSKVVWMKPPWSCHLLDGVYEFLVGKCISTGRIMCSSKENYFVSRGTFRPPSLMVNLKPLRLIVLTVGIVGSFDFLHFLVHQHFTPEEAAMHPYKSEEIPLHTLKTKFRKTTKTNRSRIPRGDHSVYPKLCHSEAWILDVDLTFFSVRDEIKSVIPYNSPDYQAFMNVYYQHVDTMDDEKLMATMTERDVCMKNLPAVYTHLMSQPIEQPLKQTAIGRLVEVIKRRSLDWRLIHSNGVRFTGMCEPHHRITEAETTYLLSAMSSLVSQMPKKPVMITIARSNGSCPHDQISFISTILQETLDEHFRGYNPVHYVVSNEADTQNPIMQNDLDEVQDASSATSVTRSLSEIQLSTDGERDDDLYADTDGEMDLSS